jgi:SAM-dependent methyltransferase
MSISNTGYWEFEAQGSPEHCYDAAVAASLVQLADTINPALIYDFGCGEGRYTNNFILHGYRAKGFDGNPSTAQIANCCVQDLTDESLDLPPVDFLMSLEVAEHIPKQFEAAYIHNLHKHVNPGGWLIISWAVEGQGGLGHVNCQNNDYVVALFSRLGYAYLQEESTRFRKNVQLPWFKNTIMIFRKN